MKTFFLRIRSSVYDPAFYEREVLGGPLASALKFLFGIFTLLAFVSTAAFLIIRGSDVASFSKRILPDIVRAYPDDAVIVLKDGSISTNKADAVHVAWPDAIRDFASNNLPADSFIVVDPSTPFSLDAFRGRDTLIWAFERGFALRSGRTDAQNDFREGEIRLYDFPKEVTATVTKTLVEAKLAKLRPLAKAVPYLAGAGIFLGTLLLNVSRLAYLLPLALIILFAVRLTRKRKLTYGESYRVGVYAMSPGLVVWTLMSAFGIPLHIPLGFTALMLIIAVANVQEARRAQITNNE